MKNILSGALKKSSGEKKVCKDAVKVQPDKYRFKIKQIVSGMVNNIYSKFKQNRQSRNLGSH